MGHLPGARLRLAAHAQSGAHHRTLQSDLADPVRKAAGILQSNMAAGRIPDDGFLLLALAPYVEIGVDRARAELKSRFLSGFAADVITREFPDLAQKMRRRTGIFNWGSRNLELLESA